MKVKIKGLNEEVEVVEEKDVINNRTVYYDKVTHQRYPEDMIEIVDDYATEKVSYVQMPIDWQHYRIQAAIAAMQGQLANQILTENMIESVENVADFPKVAVNASVRIADALIAELKKGGQDGK